MSSITLSHIVPTFHPQNDGVGDYALNLARHLRQLHGVQSRFIVCDPKWDGPCRVEGFSARRLRRRNEAGLWSLLAAAREQRVVALLHYNGHGYDRLGIPLWLYKGIRSWVTEGLDGSHRQLFTVFHESRPAAAKPWEKRFLLSNLQGWLIRGLHRLSEISVTGTRQMRSVLDGIQANKTWCLPMPSNISPVDFTNTRGNGTSRLRVAIFGGTGTRAAAVRVHANLLRTLDKKNMLASAILVGSGLDTAGRRGQDLDLLGKSVSSSRIQVLGESNPQDIAQTLGRAHLFLSPHPAEFACNSGSFMAALAAGCPPVLPNGRNAEPLRENEHFLASDDSPSSVRRFEQLIAEGSLPRLATAGRAWYQRNADWRVIAGEFNLALSQERLREKPLAGIAKPSVRSIQDVDAAAVCSRASIA
jgi:hypothetical protein